MYSTIEELTSLTSLFDLFDDLYKAGSSIRSIITDSLLNTELYEQLNSQPSIDGLSNITFDIYLQQLKETSTLFIPVSLRTNNLSTHFDIKQATCLLDEMLFWLIKYQIPDRLLKFLLQLLADMNFKRLYTLSFLNVYGMAISQLIYSRISSRRTIGSRVAHLTVQLFSNPNITIQAIKDHHLLELLLSSLHLMIITNCKLQKSNENYHLATSESHFSKTTQYWPIISDFINVLSHEYASREFLFKKKFIITWIKMISSFQGKNLI